MKNIEQYKAELAAINNSLPAFPDGYLIKRGKYLSHRINGKDVGLSKNPKLVRMLCRKKYLIERKTQLEEIISFIENSANKIETSASKTIKSFSTAYQGLPISNFYHSSIDDWLNKPFSQNPYQLENLSYHSRNGIPVRSKSEAIIANLLEEYEIPYKYEILLELNGRPIYPDFTVKNPFTGKTVIWEHFGALHQPEYEQKMTNKMSNYLKHGYKPFENLIYTFEFDLLNGEQRLRDLIENVIL